MKTSRDPQKSLVAIFSENFLTLFFRNHCLELHGKWLHSIISILKNAKSMQFKGEVYAALNEKCRYCQKLLKIQPIKNLLRDVLYTNSLSDQLFLRQIYRGLHNWTAQSHLQVQYFLRVIRAALPLTPRRSYTTDTPLHKVH